MLLKTMLEKGAIWFERIEEGLDNYSYFYLEGTEEELLQEIKDLVIKNDYENSFVDFYYGRLSLDEKEIVQKALTKDEIDYIYTLNLEDNIYFPLDEKLLTITVKLSAREILFSTFYFCKTPCTVWGNYNKKFPVFYTE